MSVPDWTPSSGERRDKTYHALQDADLELGESLAGLVTVSDILESLGCVLATNVKEHLLAAAVFSTPLASASASKGKRIHRKGTRSDGCACARKPDAGKYDLEGGVGFIPVVCCARASRQIGERERWEGELRGENLRMLIDELGRVVDLVVDDDVDVLLGVVLGNVLVGELLERHLGGGRWGAKVRELCRG